MSTAEAPRNAADVGLGELLRSAKEGPPASGRDSVGDQLADLVRGQYQSDLTPPALPAPLAQPAGPSSPRGAGSGGEVGAPAPLLFSNEAMIALMLEHPEYSHSQLAKAFGRPASWLSVVLASDSFQAALDPYRGQIADPSLTASLQERFRALAIRTSSVLLERMNNPAAADLLVLKSVEVSVKALGMGNAHSPQAPKEAPSTVADLADHLMTLMKKKRSGEIVDVDFKERRDE